MKLDDPSRLLYSTQFHPEMAKFDESTDTDSGFGQSFLGAFLLRAREWWRDHDVELPAKNETTGRKEE